MTQRVWKNRHRRCEHGFLVEKKLCPECCGTEHCGKCGLERPYADFIGRSGNILSYCASCRARQDAYDAAWKARNARKERAA